MRSKPTELRCSAEKGARFYTQATRPTALDGKRAPAWTLVIVVDGTRSHISSHDLRRHAEANFRRLTGYAWKEFKRGSKATAKFAGSSIEKAGSRLKERASR